MCIGERSGTFRAIFTALISQMDTDFKFVIVITIAYPLNLQPLRRWRNW